MSNTLRVGSPVYATSQGLGYLAKSFFDAGIITNPLVVRHSSRTNHLEWYNSVPHSFCDPSNPGLLRRQLQALCRRIDVLLVFETPFDWSIIPYCKGIGVKTVITPMYECTPKDQLNHPYTHPQQPDLILNPSDLDQQYFPQGIRCHIPVESDVINGYRERTTLTTFVHNAGHGGLKGRNGTAEVLRAWNYVRSPARLIIRSQKALPGVPSSRTEVFCPGGPRGTAADPRHGQTIEYKIGSVSRHELYAEGDCLLFPEKFNGLSLPLQEAYASGMLVMATNRFPNSNWLPDEPLIPVKEYVQEQVSGRCYSFKSAVIDPEVLASHIDRWYGRDITAYSKAGLEFARNHSWDTLRPWYLKILTDLVSGTTYRAT